MTNDGSGTVTIVNARTVRVTCKESDGTAIETARVLLEAATGGDLPFAEAVTLSVTSSVCTATHTAHGLTTGKKVAIKSLDIAGVTSATNLRGVKTITVTGVNAYTYATTAGDGTPTGTITSTAVILDGSSNASGVVEDTSFSFTNTQPVTGIVRKSTASPLFVPAPLSGSITSAGGYDVIATMGSDE